MMMSWKGPATNSVVPSYSYNQINSGTAYTGMARPIKHWRKQLLPTHSSSSGRAAVGMPMDTPGGAVYLGNSSQSCLPYETATGIKENIEKYNNTNFITTPGDKFYDATNMKTVCIACNPPNQVIRRASSKMSSTYYSDTKGYLRSRGISYDQKLSANKAPGIIYFQDGQPVPPSDSPTGSQIRFTQSCGLTCQPGNRVTSIQKPNNIQYFQQSSVDSSSRMERVKINTINKTPAPLLADGKPKKMGLTHFARYPSTY
jgi:hypothetical protein